MSAAEHPYLDLIVPARAEALDLVHELIAQLWTHDDSVGTIDRIRFETAVIEIMGNIVEHATLVDPPLERPRTVALVVTTDDDEVVARFNDDGKPMGIDLSDVAMPGEEAESGRGLALAVAAVDDVSYERQGDTNHWRVACRRSA